MGSFSVKSPNDLINIFIDHHNDYEINYDCPYDDSYAAKKIYEIFKTLE